MAELDGKVEWVDDEIITWKHPSGTWYRYRPFFDPEGNMLYVTEPHKLGDPAGASGSVAVSRPCRSPARRRRHGRRRAAWARPHALTWPSRGASTS